MDRHTPQRAAVLAVILRAGRPLLPQEVLQEAGSEAPGISIATVYRALKKLADAGVIAPVALGVWAAERRMPDRVRAIW